MTPTARRPSRRRRLRAIRSNRLRSRCHVNARRAGREQPDGNRERAERVGGRRRRSGQLTEHRGECVKRRRVVQRIVGLDVAQLAHVRRRRLAGVDDPADRVGVPDGVPRARDRLPVRQPLDRRDSDQRRAEQYARGHGERRTAGDRQRLGVTVAEAAQHQSANTRRAQSRPPEQTGRSIAFHGMPIAPNGTMANATTP